MTTTTKVYRCFVCDFESENHRDILLHLKIQDGHMETLGQLVAEVTVQEMRALSPVNEDNDVTAIDQLIDSVDFCDRFYRHNECTILPCYRSNQPHPLNWPSNLNMFTLDVSTFKCYKCDFSTTDLRQQQKHLKLSRDSARLGSVRYAFLFLCPFPTCQEEKNKKYDNLKEYSQHLYNCHLQSSDGKGSVNVQASAQLIDTKADPAIIDLSATYQCHLCQVSRCSLTSLHQHFKSIHSAEFFPINQITVKLDLNVENIVESLPTISDEYSHRCYECQKDFSFCIALKKHFEEAHPDQVLDLSKAISVKCEEKCRQFSCYVCEHKHASLNQLRLHFADQHPTESFKSSRLQCQLLRCKTCDNFWTFDESRLQKHYKSQKHKRRAIFSTKPTDLVSLKSQEVKKQEQCEEEEEEPKLSESVEKVKFACEPCGLEYPMKCNLIRHLNSQKHSEKLKDTKSTTITKTVEEEAISDLSKEETEINGDKGEAEILVCQPCNYQSSHKWNFQVHLATKKHQLLCNPDGGNETLESSPISAGVSSEDQVAMETVAYYDDNDEEEFQCLPCEFKTKFRKTWESHINHRNHKDLLKEVEVEDKNAAMENSRNLNLILNNQEDEEDEEDVGDEDLLQHQDSSNLENNIGINGVELTIVFRQSSPDSKENEYRCSQCDFRCRKEDELNCHLQDLHNSSGAEFIDDKNCNMVGTWKCRQCPRLFSSQVSLKRHCTWKHKKTTLDHPLTGDGEEASTKKAAVFHSNNSSEILSVKCDHCPRTFNSPISLKRHCTWKHPNPVSESGLSPSILASSFFQDDHHQSKFPCFFCPREFDSAMSRKRHCTWKHPEEQRNRNTDEVEHKRKSPFGPELAKFTVDAKDDDFVTGTKQFTCENCGFRGKNLKAISGHWNKKKSCRPVDRRSVDFVDDPDQDSEVLEFTTARVGEEVTYNCNECSFRGASKKSLMIHISCTHRSSKAIKRYHVNDNENDSVVESGRSSPKQAKIEDSEEDCSEDEDEDAREIIDSIVQDIPISAVSLSSCKLTAAPSSSSLDVVSRKNSPSRSYTMMTNVEDEIHLSEEEDDLVDEDIAEGYDEDDNDEEDLHLFINDDDDDDQVEVSQVETLANVAVGKRSASLSSSASFSSESESTNFVIDEKQIANGKKREEENPKSEVANTKATKMLYKCDHCDFSNFHQDVMAVHNLVHKQPSVGSAASDKEYNTIQEKTICMCCAHCQFKTKDFEEMMEHNKKEHPEPEL